MRKRIGEQGHMVVASTQSNFSKSIEGLWLATFVVGALCIFLDSATAQLDGQDVPQSVTTACAERMRTFIVDLDSILDQNPRTIWPVRNTVVRGAPATNCDVAEITALVK